MTEKKHETLVLDFGTVKFNKRKHTYSIDGTVLTSVTTWIKQFFEPFDAKAISKRMAFWAKKRGEKTTARDFIKQWKIKRDEGNDIHAYIDKYIKKEVAKNTVCEVPRKAAWAIMEISYIEDEVDVKLYSELLVANRNLKLAGTIDLMVVSGNTFKLYDWKTTDKIPTEGYTKSKHPAMKGEEDCKAVHYTLQLSAYAYMIEASTNLKCESLHIMQLKDEECVKITVPYRKDKIQEMLVWDKRL